jgi:hypothetical protein
MKFFGKTVIASIGVLGLIAFASILPSAVTAQRGVTLPVEVVGEDGTISSVTVDIPPGRSREVSSLWMQIHNLAYDDMVSVQLNKSAWFPLSNKTVSVAEPAKSYGGIGGGFATLSMTLALPADTVVDGANTIRFRLNHSDGLASGFRVVAFNLLTRDAGRLLPPDAFTQEDPNAWAPPQRDSASLQAGRELWMNGRLKANFFPNSPQIRSHCADCHAYDGRDLKYFSFSNASIIARSRFHGLSEIQGQQIASYIRSLAVPSPGRPWNPPYQPGPGLDAKPLANWAAGAGLSSVPENDSDTLAFLFRDNTAARDIFRPDGNLNPREIPISLQLPDWNHWLPRVHPLDAWGTAFENSDFLKLYGWSSYSDGKLSSGASKDSLRAALTSPSLAALISSGRIVTLFEKWTNARRALLKPYVERGNVNWTPDLGQKVYSTQLWQLVKTWEMAQEFGLEGRGRELFGAGGEPRTWFNTIPGATAPAAANIPDGPSGMGGSALTNQYFNASWYELQVLLNSGNHRHRERSPVDWIYVIGGFKDLYNESNRPEPARLLVAVIKALQSTDPRIGPEDVAQGWRPEQNVDPTIMVSSTWAPIFEPLSRESKRTITESFLAAWLEKNLQYPVGGYFRGGFSQNSYEVPASYGGIAGGKVWESAPMFNSAGVSADLIKRLQNWGVAYTETAARFQYAPNSSRTRGTETRKSR